MKCQILFSGKNKKNISKCCLLKILPRVLSVKHSMSDKEEKIKKNTTHHVGLQKSEKEDLSAKQ